MRRALLTCAFASVARGDVYVSPAGSDSNSGTPSSPVASLFRAQQLLRASLPSSCNTTVYLRAGSYFLNSTLFLGAPDSGSGSLSYARWVGGWPGDDPGGALVHGGAAVAGWAQMDAARGIWAALFPAGVADTRQAYYIKQGAAAARIPPAASPSGLGSRQMTATGYLAPAAAVGWMLNGQQNARDLEFLYTGVGSSWTESRLRVEAVAPIPNSTLLNISMQQPGWTFRPRAFGQGLSYPVTIANAYAFLEPGTFYANSATRTLYYAVRAGDDLQRDTVVLPSLDVLVNAAGTKWLSIENITFSFAGWLQPNSIGYVDIQSGFRYVDVDAYKKNPANDTLWVPVPGNIQMHSVENASVRGCTFSHLGATALEINDGSQSVAVLNNTFFDVSGGGLLLGQVNDLNETNPARENGHFLVDGNAFLGVPVEFHDCAALLAGFVVNTTISHNAVINNSNIGISLGWGWNRDLAANAGFNTVRANYVWGSNWLLYDGGSIYTLGPQPNSTISENCAHPPPHPRARPTRQAAPPSPPPSPLRCAKPGAVFWGNLH